LRSHESLWTARSCGHPGGKDIFSEGFTLHDDHVEVVDFNQEKYRIDLSTGSSTIVG
jgi:hypothetical protein